MSISNGDHRLDEREAAVLRVFRDAAVMVASDHGVPQNGSSLEHGHRARGMSPPLPAAAALRTVAVTVICFRFRFAVAGA